MMEPRAIPGERRRSYETPTRFTRERLVDIKPTFADPLVEGILPRTGVAFFAGPSTAAKTFLALEISLRVSRGEPVAGRSTCQAGAIYIAAEDAEGVRHRVKAWRDRNGDRGRFALIPEAPNLLDDTSVIALVSQIEEAAKEMAAVGMELGLAVIDTMSKAAPGADQNASSDMGDVMSVLEKLATRLGILILVVAHTPKDESRGIAGWYGQFTGADAVIMCTRDANDTELRLATVVKLKNGRDGSCLAFRLEEVKIGKTPLGKPVTSCVVAFEDLGTAPAKRKKAVRVSQFAAVTLRAVKYMYDHGETQPAPPLQGVRRGARAVRIDDVHKWALKTGLANGDDKPGTVRMRWSRAVADLIAANKICQHDKLVWLV
jgi:KaiC/GvpD/RAD55 family RecA-like ATPase